MGIESGRHEKNKIKTDSSGDGSKCIHCIEESRKLCSILQYLCELSVIICTSKCNVYFCSTPTPTYKRWHWQLYSRKLDGGLNAQRSMHTVFICRLFAYVFVQYAHCYLFFFGVSIYWRHFLDEVQLNECLLSLEMKY